MSQKKTSKKKRTINQRFDQVLEMISKFSTQMDKKFATKEDLKCFATKEDLKCFATKEDLKDFATKEDLKNLESKLTSKLVTKDYLDDKLADQYSDLVILMRKEDDKVKALI